MYKLYIKRCVDIIISIASIVILFPIWGVLMIVGAIAMKGNPFFIQRRIGYKEKEFKLIKFRTMSNARDNNGKLLPNDMRLNKYGKVLRTTSLDELPELINILVGTMSVVGPRPLLPEYLPYYTDEEHHRHDLRPGLTGLAQVNGRNAISNWEERFKYDLEYIKNCSLWLDVKIVVKTVKKVIMRSDIVSGGTLAVVGRLDEERDKQRNKKK